MFALLDSPFFGGSTWADRSGAAHAAASSDSTKPDSISYDQVFPSSRSARKHRAATAALPIGDRANAAVEDMLSWRFAKAEC
jgi:hypothetical protein